VSLVDLYSPIFIGGMFKSGTSLLRAMIGNHSQVASGLETYWFDIDWSAIHGSEMQNRLHIIAEFYEIDKESINNLVTESSCTEIFLTKLMEKFTHIKNKNRWAEKTPGNVVHIDRIKSFWPNAKFLHIIRDPRDIFASMREAKKWDNVSEFMERWSTVFSNVEKFNKNGLLTKESYLEVRYEDLISNTEEIMQSVCLFSGLDYEPEISMFFGIKNDFDKVKYVTGKESTTLAHLAKPINSNRIGIWRKVLSSNDIYKLEVAVAKSGLSESYTRACLR
jgi:protein-tyrosine sulfotransferase